MQYDSSCDNEMVDSAMEFPAKQVVQNFTHWPSHTTRFSNKTTPSTLYAFVFVLNTINMLPYNEINMEIWCGPFDIHNLQDPRPILLPRLDLPMKHLSYSVDLTSSFLCFYLQTTALSAAFWRLSFSTKSRCISFNSLAFAGKGFPQNSLAPAARCS